VPARTGSNISAETTLRLSEHPNIIGIKEASGNLMQCLEILSHKPSSFLMISGDDMFTVPLMSLGGVGVISVIANAVPASFSLAVRKCLQGDYPAASCLIHQLFELTRLIFEEGNPAGVKLTLETMGICQPWVRLPLVEGSANLKRKIMAELQNIEQAIGALQPTKPLPGITTTSADNTRLADF
jgi:4-hydroxy-tetrahydrodipicolinate synthase